MNSPKNQAIKSIIDNSTIDLYSQVETALNYVSPDCSRDEWFKLLCSIHDALNDSGYEIAKSWSQQSNKFNAKNFNYTWINEVGKKSGVTKAYLFKLAYENGMPKFNPPTAHQEQTNDLTPLEQFNRCKPFTSHPYIAEKDLNGKLNGYEYVLRLGHDSFGNWIADPIYNLETREFMGFNRIKGSGKNSKGLAKGTKKAGNAGIVGNLDATTKYACITEGLADALHIHNETKYPVLIASDAGNIKNVVKIIMKLYPKLTLIICADSDTAGKRAAENAKRESKNCFVAYPPSGKDFTESVLNGDDIKTVIANAINLITTETPAAVYKPMVIINGTSLSEVKTPTCLNALAEKNRGNPYLFSKNNKLVRIELSTDKDGIRSLNTKDIDVKTLLHELDRAVRFVVVKSNDDGVYFVDSNPPKIIAEDILAFPNFPDFPQLKRVVTAPCVTHNGRLITQKGYDDESGIFYHQHESLSVGDTFPTVKNVSHAKSFILDDLLVDFPFDTEASRANAIAAFLLPFCRDLIKGCTPLHLITAPTQGTGKTLLALCIANVFNPFVHVSTAPEGRNPNDVEEEWRKKITTQLMSTPSHIIFDNMAGYTASSNFASVLTRTTWSDRLLGNNSEITLNNNAVWIATGNNAELNTDLARRTLEIRLDANMEKPTERNDFKHHNIEQWATENRSQLITAILTLIRNWLEQGKPKPTNTPQMGSFEQYRYVIGGILQAAEIQGFLQNYQETQARVDSNTLMFQAFFDAWYNGIPVEAAGLTKIVGKFADIPQLPNELHEVAREVGMFDNFLYSKDQKGETTKLGRWLNKNTGKVYGKYKLVSCKNRGKNTYRLLCIANK